MAGLMDTINQQLSSSAGTAPAPAMGATEQTAGLLRAKIGKADTGMAAPAQSNIGEQVAQQQTNTGLKQVGQANQMATQQLGQQQADIQTKANEQQATHQEQLNVSQSDYAQKATAILNNLAANTETLQTGKQQAQMDQAAFLIRGTNNNYIQELQRQGNLNRLTDKTSYQQETAQTVMGDMSELFKNDLQFQTLINANARDFDSALQGMSENFALNMGHLAIQGMNAATAVTGISGLVTGGVAATDTYLNKKPAAPTPTTSTTGE